QTHVAFSPQESAPPSAPPSGFVQRNVQKCVVWSPRMEHVVALPFPEQSENPVQYLPTPCEFPTSPGFPHVEVPESLVVVPLSADVPPLEEELLLELHASPSAARPAKQDSAMPRRRILMRRTLNEGIGQAQAEKD